MTDLTREEIEATAAANAYKSIPQRRAARAITQLLAQLDAANARADAAAEQMRERCAEECDKRARKAIKQGRGDFIAHEIDRDTIRALPLNEGSEPGEALDLIVAQEGV